MRTLRFHRQLPPVRPNQTRGRRRHRRIPLPTHCRLVRQVPLGRVSGCLGSLAQGYQAQDDRQVLANPCLGSVDVTPWRTRLDFPDCHYITVSSPSGGDGGFRSVNFSAFRTRHASGQPPLTPRRSGRSSRRNVTKRTVCSASIARSAEELIPASSSRRSRSRCTKSARAATTICAFNRAYI